MTFKEASALLQLPKTSRNNPRILLEAKLRKNNSDSYTLVIGMMGNDSQNDELSRFTDEENKSWYIVAIRRDMMQPTPNTLDGKVLGRMEVTGQAYLIMNDQEILGPSKARQGLHTGFWIYLH